MKQRNLNTVFANISKTISPTSDSFLLIMSHIVNIIMGAKWFVIHHWEDLTKKKVDYKTRRTHPVLFTVYFWTFISASFDFVVVVENRLWAMQICYFFIFFKTKLTVFNNNNKKTWKKEDNYLHPCLGLMRLVNLGIN